MKIEKANKPLQLSSPQARYANLVHSIFDADPEIEVTSNCIQSEDKESYEHVNHSINASNKYWIKIDTANYSKLLAIRELLGTYKEFGNIKIAIKYSCHSIDVSKSAWEIAFQGNPYFVDLKSSSEKLPMSEDTLAYVIFTQDVVSFYNDDLSTYDGYLNMLVADAIKEVVGDDRDVFICTESNK